MIATVTARASTSTSVSTTAMARVARAFLQPPREPTSHHGAAIGHRPHLPLAQRDRRHLLLLLLKDPRRDTAATGDERRGEGGSPCPRRRPPLRPRRRGPTP